MRLEPFLLEKRADLHRETERIIRSQRGIADFVFEAGANTFGAHQGSPSFLRPASPFLVGAPGLRGVGALSSPDGDFMEDEAVASVSVPSSWTMDADARREATRGSLESRGGVPSGVLHDLLLRERRRKRMEFLTSHDRPLTREELRRIRLEHLVSQAGAVGRPSSLRGLRPGDLPEPPWETLEAPDVRGGCGDHLVGTDFSCAELAHARVLSLEEALEQIARPRPQLVFDWDADVEPSADLKRVLRAGWKLLLSNTDLIRWSCCWLEGSRDGEDLADELIDLVSHYEDIEIFCYKYPDHMPWWWDTALLLNLSGLYEIPYLGELVESLLIGGRSATMMGLPWFDFFGIGYRGQILVNINSSKVVRRMENLWRGGRNGDRLCATIQAASVFLHELMHVARFWDYRDSRYRPLDAEEDCYSTYMMGNIFSWALGRRFSHALYASDGCCLRRLEALDTGKHHFGSGRGYELLTKACNAEYDEASGGRTAGAGVEEEFGRPPSWLRVMDWRYDWDLEVRPEDEQDEEEDNVDIYPFE